MLLNLSQCNVVLVYAFGEVTESTYSPLEDNTVLISNTTLYCVTENKNTPEVMWSYVDLAGTSTDLTSTTDASTGVSTIQVYTTLPGYYSCEVTENGGVPKMYTAGILSANIYPGILITAGPSKAQQEFKCGPCNVFSSVIVK